jgi:hypothetical protein
VRSGLLLGWRDDETRGSTLVDASRATGRRRRYARVDDATATAAAAAATNSTATAAAATATTTTATTTTTTATTTTIIATKKRLRGEGEPARTPGAVEVGRPEGGCRDGILAPAQGFLGEIRKGRARGPGEEAEANSAGNARVAVRFCMCLCLPSAPPPPPPIPPSLPRRAPGLHPLRSIRPRQPSTRSAPPRLFNLDVLAGFDCRLGPTPLSPRSPPSGPCHGAPTTGPANLAEFVRTRRSPLHAFQLAAPITPQLANFCPPNFPCPSAPRQITHPRCDPPMIKCPRTITNLPPALNSRARSIHANFYL